MGRRHNWIPWQQGLFEPKAWRNSNGHVVVDMPNGAQFIYGSKGLERLRERAERGIEIDGYRFNLIMKTRMIEGW